MRISINNCIYLAEQDETVLQVALRNNIYIPHLCYHPRTGKAASCRACIVQDVKTNKIVTSCNYPVQEGMEIITNSPEIIDSQKRIVDFILSSGDHNCLSCEANNNCELQDAAYYLGLEKGTFQIYDDRYVVDESSEFIVIDRSKCINCGRCILACNNTVVNETLARSDRGFDTKIVFDSNLPMGTSSCVQCGECLQVCPTGAIIDKRSMGKTRNWNLQQEQTICTYCGVGCKVEISLDKVTNQVVKITGVDEAPTNKGMLCVKGRFGFDYINSTERLTQPLIKKNGEFKPASWDEVTQYIANRFTDIKEQNGPNAIAGLASAKVTIEENYLFQKFMRREIGTNNVDHCARL